ncbi:MAG: hypothetical protein U5K51_03870 [Flavobacteriaceae bacterium]|nr:hypothetical protein [Flavobacteriaceae bacterium]
MKFVFEKTGYILDPHGAVGYRVGNRFSNNSSLIGRGIFLKLPTSVKFLEVIEPVIQQKIAYPPQIQAVMK